MVFCFYALALKLTLQEDATPGCVLGLGGEQLTWQVLPFTQGVQAVSPPRNPVIGQAILSFPDEGTCPRGRS